jgi:hypothetical protein
MAPQYSDMHVIEALLLFYLLFYRTQIDDHPNPQNDVCNWVHLELIKVEEKVVNPVAGVNNILHVVQEKVPKQVFFKWFMALLKYVFLLFDHVSNCLRIIIKPRHWLWMLLV